MRNFLDTQKKNPNSSVIDFAFISPPCLIQVVGANNLSPVSTFKMFYLLGFVSVDISNIAGTPTQ